eukprot:1544710-Amphidinium_carterae.3
MNNSSFDLPVGFAFAVDDRERINSILADRDAIRNFMTDGANASLGNAMPLSTFALRRCKLLLDRAAIEHIQSILQHSNEGERRCNHLPCASHISRVESHIPLVQAEERPLVAYALECQGFVTGHSAGRYMPIHLYGALRHARLAGPLFGGPFALFGMVTITIDALQFLQDVYIWAVSVAWQLESFACASDYMSMLTLCLPWSNISDSRWNSTWGRDIMIHQFPFRASNESDVLPLNQQAPLEHSTANPLARHRLRPAILGEIRNSVRDFVASRLRLKLAIGGEIQNLECDTVAMQVRHSGKQQKQQLQRLQKHGKDPLWEM